MGPGPTLLLGDVPNAIGPLHSILREDALAAADAWHQELSAHGDSERATAAARRAVKNARELTWGLLVHIAARERDG